MGISTFFRCQTPLRVTLRAATLNLTNAPQIWNRSIPFWEKTSPQKATHGRNLIRSVQKHLQKSVRPNAPECSNRNFRFLPGSNEPHRSGTELGRQSCLFCSVPNEKHCKNTSRHKTFARMHYLLPTSASVNAASTAVTLEKHSLQKHVTDQTFARMTAL